MAQKGTTRRWCTMVISDCCFSEVISDWSSSSQQPEMVCWSRTCAVIVDANNRENLSHHVTHTHTHTHTNTHTCRLSSHFPGDWPVARWLSPSICSDLEYFLAKKTLTELEITSNALLQNQRGIYTSQVLNFSGFPYLLIWLIRVKFGPLLCSFIPNLIFFHVVATNRKFDRIWNFLSYIKCE